MSYDGVIFDKDGVLLDSMKNNYRWADELRVEEAAKEGYDLDIEDVRLIVRADSPEELKKVREKTGLTNQEIINLETKVVDEKIRKIKDGEIPLFNSVEKVLSSIDQPKSVASNAPKRATDFTVQYFDLDDRFEKVLAPELNDLERFTRIRKPSKTMLEDAIKAMDSNNPIMVGDTSDDIGAAKNAGIDSVHIKSNGDISSDPTYQIEKLEQLLEILE